MRPGPVQCPGCQQPVGPPIEVAVVVDQDRVDGGVLPLEHLYVLCLQIVNMAAIREAFLAHLSKGCAGRWELSEDGGPLRFSAGVAEPE